MICIWSSSKYWVERGWTPSGFMIFLQEQVYNGTVKQSFFFFFLLCKILRKFRSLWIISWIVFYDVFHLPIFPIHFLHHVVSCEAVVETSNDDCTEAPCQFPFAADMISKFGLEEIIKLWKCSESFWRGISIDVDLCPHTILIGKIPIALVRTWICQRMIKH